ncbi:hypothetical protein HNY73_013885 [Argiope bruennichi]|uniref:Uncharacterized protein n=1 Tax=Argiope bruennichi TaxID=94029 RepID=A0A8T0EM69_ARGBR|nr:hypothetical protein HNY73_013885 [Argiope bruennichi]
MEHYFLYICYGSHKLEVILHSDILINFSVSEDAEFASALYRLFRWHGAHTTILQAEESDDSNIKKWCEIMDMEFLEDSTNHTLGPSVWRGDLRFLNPNVAFIVQMGYSIATNKPKPDRSLSTVKWQKMILSGDIKFYLSSEDVRKYFKSSGESKDIAHPVPVSQKLRVAVASALEKNAINLGNALFRPCFKKLFTICQAFVKVIEFEKQK